MLMTRAGALLPKNQAADAAAMKIRESADADDARLGLLQLGKARCS